MGNDNEALARLWKLQAKVNMLVLDGKRAPSIVADAFQKILEKRYGFYLFKDLGIVTVPDNYDPLVSQPTFLAARQDCNWDAIEPSHALKPGEKFWIRVFKHGSEDHTSEEWMRFLSSQGAIYTGAQGAAFVLRKKYDQLPENHWYVSFDTKKHLPKADEWHIVPVINGPQKKLDHEVFEKEITCWDFNQDAFLCFSVPPDVPEDQGKS